MKITMEEVARAARVCRATVSLALRGKPQIPEKTRRRIQAVANRLGYAPHPLVSALMATRRKGRASFQATVAFLTNHDSRQGWRTSSLAYAALFRGAAVRAESLGYKLQDFWMREPGVSGERLRNILQARSIRGAILAPLPAENTSLPAFDWSSFAVLAVGYSVREPEFHRISHDYFHGMTTALKHCRARGYRRVGFFLDRRVNEVVFNLWLASYLAEQRTAPDSPALEPMLIEHWRDPRILRWIGASRLDALVCLDPWRLREYGVRVPPTVKLVALNADESQVPTVGIRRDFDVIGAAAMDRVASLLQLNEIGPAGRAQTILVEGVWINGDLLPSARAASTVSKRCH